MGNKDSIWFAFFVHVLSCPLGLIFLVESNDLIPAITVFLGATFKACRA